MAGSENKVVRSTSGCFCRAKKKKKRKVSKETDLGYGFWSRRLLGGKLICSVACEGKRNKDKTRRYKYTERLLKIVWCCFGVYSQGATFKVGMAWLLSQRLVKLRQGGDVLRSTLALDSDQGLFPENDKVPVC